MELAEVSVSSCQLPGARAITGKHFTFSCQSEMSVFGLGKICLGKYWYTDVEHYCIFHDIFCMVWKDETLTQDLKKYKIKINVPLYCKDIFS